jgi:hypothetical protein
MMSICSRCGDTISFRYIGGRCIPLHSSGGCGETTASTVTDYTNPLRKTDSTCFGTSCPECGDNVYFIKHNGGSVWVDPPLGPPWPIHGCFDTESTTSNLANLYQIKMSSETEGVIESSIIGVVTTASVDFLKRFTSITLKTGKTESLKLKLKNNSGFLLGELCVFSVDKGCIFPVKEDGYVFELYYPINNSGLISCPECPSEVSLKNIENHLKKQHGHQY